MHPAAPTLFVGPGECLTSRVARAHHTPPLLVVCARPKPSHQVDFQVRYFLDGPGTPGPTGDPSRLHRLEDRTVPRTRDRRPSGWTTHSCVVACATAGFRAVLRIRALLLRATAGLRAVLRIRASSLCATASFRAAPRIRALLLRATAGLRAVPRIRASSLCATAGFRAAPRIRA